MKFQVSFFLSLSLTFLKNKKERKEEEEKKEKEKKERSGRSCTADRANIISR